MQTRRGPMGSVSLPLAAPNHKIYSKAAFYATRTACPWFLNAHAQKAHFWRRIEDAIEARHEVHTISRCDASVFPSSPSSIRPSQQRARTNKARDCLMPLRVLRCRSNTSHYRARPVRCVRGPAVACTRLDRCSEQVLTSLCAAGTEAAHQARCSAYRCKPDETCRIYFVTATAHAPGRSMGHRQFSGPLCAAVMVVPFLNEEVGRTEIACGRRSA